MPFCRICISTKMIPELSDCFGLSFKIKIFRCPKCGLIKGILYQEDMYEWEEQYKELKRSRSLLSNLDNQEKKDYLSDTEDDESH
jgi:hypothetical protein